MTRPYELVYIFDSAMDEAQIQEHLERFHALITTPENPEPVSASAHWGKRTLAYPLDRRDVGYYVVEQCDAPAEVLHNGIELPADWPPIRRRRRRGGTPSPTWRRCSDHTSGPMARRRAWSG